MSTIINQNYSQFYKGTENAKTYGSGENGKKDKIVKYQFNTTDEKGNKIMDKMSREETLQAMKDIRSQYGDDVIVEFSGDGMAALVESKYSGHGADLDKIMGREQRVIPEDMVTQLEGTYQKVSENDEVNTRVSWHDTLKEKAPDVCNELDDLMQRILDHGLNHNGDGEKFGKKFIELVTKAEKAIAAYDEKEDIAVDKPTVGETQLSEKAQALLKRLRETYGDMDFFVADFSKGDNAKDILSKAGKEFSVILTVEELEKMASDEKYEKEYMDRVQGARRMSEQINKEYGFTSASGEAASRTKVNKIAISFNEDGTTTFFAELEKSSQRQRERIESAREERRAEHKKQAERTTVQANSIEELIEQIKKVDWTKVTEEK